MTQTHSLTHFTHFGQGGGLHQLLRRAVTGGASLPSSMCGDTQLRGNQSPLADTYETWHPTPQGSRRGRGGGAALLARQLTRIQTSAASPSFLARSSRSKDQQSVRSRLCPLVRDRRGPSPKLGALDGSLYHPSAPLPGGTVWKPVKAWVPPLIIRIIHDMHFHIGPSGPSVRHPVLAPNFWRPLWPHTHTPPPPSRVPLLFRSRQVRLPRSHMAPPKSVPPRFRCLTQFVLLVLCCLNVRLMARHAA